MLCYDTKTTIFINNIKFKYIYIFRYIILFSISFLDVSLKVLLIVSPKVSLMSFKVLLSLDFKVSLIVSLIVSFIVLLLKIELYE